MRTNRALVGLLALTTVTFLTHCRTGGPPPNTDPSCQPCTRFVPDTTVAECASLSSVPIRDGDPTFKNLVFKGGGVKGIAYAGALGAFGDERLARVKKVAGTSAGAITALIVSLGFSAQEICNITYGIDFANFEDGRFPADVERLFERFGWFKGDFALCLLECLVEAKTGNRKTTFAELHELALNDPNMKDLFVFGTDVNNHRSVEFSNDNPATRDVPIADAARISMSIPFFFATRQFDGDTFIDGGVLRGYPIKTFDILAPEEEANPETLGFFLGTEPTRDEIENLREFAAAYIGTLTNVQTDAFCRRPEDVSRSVFIDTLGIPMTDFALTDAQKRALIEQGKIGTEKFLSTTTHPETCPTFAMPPSSGLF